MRGLEEGVERGRRDPAGLERPHLVLHQGQERRDDDGEPIEDEGRDLEAERLAATGGKDPEGVAAGEDRLDDTALGRTEVGEAPVALEDLPSLLNAVLSAGCWVLGGRWTTIGNGEHGPR